jgi:hypothetical protein
VLTITDIEQGLPIPIHRPPLDKPVANVVQAGSLIDQLAVGEFDFWEGVYTPFTEGMISKEAIRELVSLARKNGATSLPKIAVALRACDPKSELETEKKLFFRFKNFLYKTIKIS